MAFSDLSPMVQDMLVADFEFKTKAVMLIGVLIFCIFYLGYLNSKPKTPYLMTNLFKTMIKFFCYVYILSSPLFSWLLSPAVKLDLVIKFVVSIYSISVICLIIWLIVNVFYYLPLYIIKLLVIDLGV